MINPLNILKAAFFTPLQERDGVTPWGLTLLFWGPPGVGKSAQLNQVARKWGLDMKVLSPGTDGEGAFGVTPVPAKGGKTMSYPPPYWVADVAGGGVVFLDEVNQAPPTLQPAIMGIALDRRIGDHVLDPKVRRVAAANPTTMAAGGWDLAPPVANRFGHLDWELPSPDAWCDWLIGSVAEDNEVHDPTVEEARVLKAWTVPWATASGVITGFIKSRPELLFKMPEDGSADLGRAWPSHRTWEMAARAMASGQVHQLSGAERETFIGAFIGSGPASELMAYIENMDLPNPEDVLDGKVKFKHDPTRLDRTAAVFSSCAALLVPEDGKNRRPRAAKLWEMLGEKAIINDAMDIGFSAAKRLVHSKLHTMKEAYPVLHKMLPVLEAAGIVFNPAQAKASASGYAA